MSMIKKARQAIAPISGNYAKYINHSSFTRDDSCKCGSWNCSGLVGKEENVQVKRNGSQEKRQITNFKQLGLGGTVGNLMSKMENLMCSYVGWNASAICEQVNPRKFEKENRATDTANLRDTFLKVLKNDPELTNEMKKTILSNEHCQHSE
ncbi:hypothetical protein L5515_017622 [Caenorhabditis briggsae]|uniref:Post-SET domain-containing protein n=1 Tax=Caenorhabditis briggsae TaxID=6238 RepID=A0AAE9JSW9_CAEBR|nr:hypothetical protein L5515_017622 [Caenorhabditis briggsae]